jgi:uncharacterized protein (TIGR03643 family)
MASRVTGARHSLSTYKIKTFYTVNSPIKIIDITQRSTTPMSKKTKHPETRVKQPEPDRERDPDDWVIWAAWADRVTFEEIFERTGLREAEVIARMRDTLKPSSFKRWRKRVHEGVSIKHRRRFVLKRREERCEERDGERYEERYEERYDQAEAHLKDHTSDEPSLTPPPPAPPPT